MPRIKQMDEDTRAEWILSIEEDICSVNLDDFRLWILTTDNPEREFELFREACCIYNQLPEGVSDALDHTHTYGADKHTKSFLQACIKDYELLPCGMTDILDKYATEAALEVAARCDEYGELCDFSEVVDNYKRDGVIK